MITINLDQVKHEREQRMAHKPVIKIILPEQVERQEKQVLQVIHNGRRKQETIDDQNARLREALLEDLANQDHEIRIERAKLTNKYNPMIRAGATQTELAMHYQRIESMTGQLQDIFDKKRHVEKFGRLPEMGTAGQAIQTSDISTLKNQRRSLNDKCCKLRRKIETGTATNAKKLPFWTDELNRCEAELSMIRNKINQLQNV